MRNEISRDCESAEGRKRTRSHDDVHMWQKVFPAFV